jgi:hypothetical protein
MSLDCGFGDDAFNPVLVPLSGVHRNEPCAEKDGLQSNDYDPCASANTTAPECPRETGGKRGKHKCQPERKVHNGGMHW